MVQEGIRISYGPTASQFGQLYCPAAATSVPVVVIIHGGWWKDNQSLDSYPTRMLVNHLVALGEVAVWNLEFRRMEAIGNNKAAPWPATLEDVAQGIDILRPLATRFQIDTRRLAVIGHSAGAHLAAWAAGRRNLRPKQPLYRSAPLSPTRVGLLAGIYDLTNCSSLEQPQQVARLIGGPPDRLSDRYDVASPIRLGLAPDVTGFLVHGTEDRIVDIGQSIRFQEREQAALELIEVKGGGHFCMLPTGGSTPSGWHMLVHKLQKFLVW